MAIKVIDLMTPTKFQERRLLLMVCREVYILFKLRQLAKNDNTILVKEVRANSEAYQSIDQLTQIYIVTNFVEFDVNFLLTSGTHFEYD